MATDLREEDGSSRSQPCAGASSALAHTPGPWKVCGTHQGPYVTGSDGLAIALIVTSYRDKAFQVRQEENARLIAAAPDLLEAACALGTMPEGYCFCSSNRIGDDSKVHEPECADLRAAIARATGAAQ